MPKKSSTTVSPIPGAKEFTPLEVLRVSTLEQLKKISDPLRVEILETVATHALTVKQVAAMLQKPPTKLYYHMAAMEEAGFVVVVETRIKSGIIEKYYRAAAESIEVDRKLLNAAAGSGDEAFEILRSSIIDSTAEELQQSHKAGLIRKSEKDTLILSKSLMHLSEQNAVKFVRKFKALIKEFDKPAKNVELNYVFAIALFPKAPKTKKTAHRPQ